MFSIIIIGFNQKNVICNAIRSILEQSYQDIEVIYVDDASTDGSVEYIESVFTDERLRIVKVKENQGSSVARLTGIKHATGDWCLFVDGDDTLCVNACEVLSRIISEQDEETDIIGFGSHVVCSEDVDEAIVTWMKGMVGEQIAGRHNADEILKVLFIERSKSWVLWNKCFRTAILRAAEASASYEHLYRYTDCYLCFIACCEAKKYYGITEPLYNYSFGPGISLRPIDIKEMKRYMSAYRVGFLLAEHAEKKGLTEEYNNTFESIKSDTINQTLDRIQLFSEEEGASALQEYIDYFGEKGLSFLFARMKGQSNELSIKSKEISKKNDEIQAQRNEIQELQNQITQQQNVIEQREAELEALFSSTSWRLTAPLRSAGSIVRDRLTEKRDE